MNTDSSASDLTSVLDPDNSFDPAELSASSDWRRDWIVGPGLVLGAETAVTWSHTIIEQDSGFPDPITHLWGAAAVDLRWPMARQLGDGRRVVIEPIAQIVWADAQTSGLPRDESLSLEFDEGNLFALNRLPAGDAYEAGTRANVGLRFAVIDGPDWAWEATAGRIWRSRDLGQFAGNTALDDETSEWLLSTRMDLPGQLSFANRALFDDDFQFSRNEARFAWSSPDLILAGSYNWLRANAAENRASDVSELSLDAEYQLDRHWTASFDYRFDFDQNRAASATLGIGYENECVSVDLSLSRRFTSSTSVAPNTDIGLEVRLTGFGDTRSTGPTRMCSG